MDGHDKELYWHKSSTQQSTKIKHVVHKTFYNVQLHTICWI